jgi:predicted RNA-binding Zn-ribbon protein involved in translation (DUF1610 family)
MVNGMETDVSIRFNIADIDKTVSQQEYKEKLVSLLQPILEQRFPENKGKQKIRIYKDRINFACPICGDSQKSNYKKRGNFILSGKFANFYKCHNCGIAQRIDHFFGDQKVNLDLSILNYIGQQVQDYSYDANTKYDMSLFLDMDVIEKYAIDRQEFLKGFGLVEAKDSPVWAWLKNRMQYDTTKFLYSYKNYIVVLNLTPSGKILGVQKRNFKGSSKYLTYKLGKLYELLKKDPKEVPEEIDTISQIFNICLINYKRPVTLFEGPLDSFLFKNSIASTGIHKGFAIDMPLRYWNDDDRDGREKSIEQINSGEEVFLWTKLKTDLGLPNRDKWDLNDLIVWLRNNNVKTPNFNNYFSHEALDIIDI